jgi:hypothetical protein
MGQPPCAGLAERPDPRRRAVDYLISLSFPFRDFAYNFRMSYFRLMDLY